MRERIAAIAALLTVSLSLAGGACAQSQTPDWETVAGGKAKFEVASVKQNDSGPPPAGRMHSNVVLSSLDDYSPTGGLLSATNFALSSYIYFAYKISPSESSFVTRQLPKWALEDRFDIEARAPESNPTKDQLRLMMQSLLADRFKLGVHREMRPVPVFALVLDKAGKTGPQLQPHSDDPPCANVPASISAGPSLPKLANGLMPVCGALVGLPVSGRMREGARDLTMEQIASFIPVVAFGAIDRPVLDQIGLEGKYDFWIEFTPDTSRSSVPSSSPAAEPGTTFLEALKEQLGLKLESTNGPVNVLVIDHIDELSPN